jgi:hypothetical protein
VDLVVAVVDGSTQVVIIMVEMAAMVDPLTRMDSLQLFLPAVEVVVGELLGEQQRERIEGLVAIL